MNGPATLFVITEAGAYYTPGLDEDEALDQASNIRRRCGTQVIPGVIMAGATTSWWGSNIGGAE